MAQPFPPRPVVAGVDGSEPSLAAARFAANEARRRGAPLHLVTAVPWPYEGLVAPPPTLDLPALLREAGRTAAASATEAVADADSTTRVRDGDAVAVLTEESAEAQLVVLGSRGAGGVAGLLLGSTATGVVAHARCPVVVLPDDTSVIMRHRRSVVVGVEGRPGDEEILAFAFEEAAARGTDLVAVHAWQDAALEPALRRITPLVDWAGVAADQEHVLDEALDGWREKEPDVVVREAVVRDRPARALLAASTTAELLVVGHRPRRTFGSTTHAVLHRATCPVVVVPIRRRADR
jgi:nucleotide-binding universal stress UspA family protein